MIEPRHEPHRLRSIGGLLVLVFLLSQGSGLAQEEIPGEVLLDQRVRILEATRDLGEEALLGRLREVGRGSYVLVPSASPELGIPIANPERIAPAAIGPQLEFRGSFDESGEFTIYDYEPVLESLRALPPTAERRVDSFEDRLGRTLEAVQVALEEALRPGAMSVDEVRGQASSLSKGLQEEESDFVSLYTESLENQKHRRQVVRAYREVRSLKAIYDDYDNHPPWSYEEIFENSRSAVAIASANAELPHCSGVLVSDRYVLTAGHCYKEDLEVWFGYAKDQRGGLAPPVRLPAVGVVVPPENLRERLLSAEFGPDFLDYMILEIDPGEGLSELPSPQCLVARNLGQGRRLYVIGYPNGAPKLVHDNAKVYLPFRLREPEFNDLRLAIEAELMNHEDGQERMEKFTESYRETTHLGFPAWELWHLGYNGQPVMGIVADTFGGDSGAPVHDREGIDHCVVGIFLGGSPDTGVRVGASWEYHEGVLPIEAIAEDLASWPETSNLVCPKDETPDQPARPPIFKIEGVDGCAGS